MGGARILVPLCGKTVDMAHLALKRKVDEVVGVDEAMRELIHNRASEAEMVSYARQQGPGIRDDGRARVLSGQTSVEEVLRVTQED